MDKLDPMVACPTHLEALCVGFSWSSKCRIKLIKGSHSPSDILIPLSPSLPLYAPLATASLRSLTTAEYLHQPYFETKGMSSAEIWRWVEERKWAYRAFGFTSSLVESIPVLGLFFSISNRIGAAMW
jgi:hypothetical protein